MYWVGREPGSLHARAIHWTGWWHLSKLRLRPDVEAMAVLLGNDWDQLMGTQLVR